MTEDRVRPLSEWFKKLKEGDVLTLAEFIDDPPSIIRSHFDTSEESPDETIHTLYSRMIDGLLSENAKSQIIAEAQRIEAIRRNNPDYDPEDISEWGPEHFMNITERARRGMELFSGILPQAFEKLGYFEKKWYVKEPITPGDVDRLTTIIENKDLDLKIKESARKCAHNIIDYYRPKEQKRETRRR